MSERDQQPATPPSASDTSADGSPNVEWKRLIDMPTDTLAHRIVGSLILAKGNLVGYRAIIKRVLDDIAKEHEVARSESATLAALGCGPTDNVPDPAAAMHKLFAKMDEQDMATLNWIIKGRANGLQSEGE